MYKILMGAVDLAALILGLPLAITILVMASVGGLLYGAYWGAAHEGVLGMIRRAFQGAVALPKLILLRGGN